VERDRHRKPHHGGVFALGVNNNKAIVAFRTVSKFGKDKVHQLLVKLDVTSLASTDMMELLE
jgi:hypothetical protein